MTAFFVGPGVFNSVKYKVFVLGEYNLTKNADFEIIINMHRSPESIAKCFGMSTTRGLSQIGGSGTALPRRYLCEISVFRS